VLHGPANPARAALISRLCTDFVGDAVGLGESIDAALRELPAGHLDAEAKAWSLRHVHDFLMQAPILHRARHKPFGYPGDYEVMNFIYAGSFEGSTLFARAVSLAFTRTRAALAVRTRKDRVKRELQALLARRAGSAAPVRVLSIAAGPAQELFELLEEAEEMPARLEVVLFEQDKHALAHAWHRLRSIVEARFSGQVTLTFLHDSIKRLLRDRDLFAPFGKFDLIFSCGLYDYLADRTAVILSSRLARSLRPGGRLLVANMVDHPTRWILEHHLDWPLIYRTHQELLDLGREAVPGARVELLEEESGVNPFFDLEHP
jgi:extracellular factor (EF) 3-hydroxypalmitic acid methyl ester biosynthesis protein